MHRFLGTLVMAIAIVLVGCGPSSVNIGQQFIDKPAPYAKFTMLDGEYKLLQEYRGQDVVVIFWATWCHRSTPVIEAINKYARSFKDRKDVQFLAVSIDKAEKLTKVTERAQYLENLRHAFSGNEAYDEAWQTFQGTDLPYILIIDKTGRVVDVGNSEEVVIKHIH